MVIDNLDIFGVIALPFKADAPLMVSQKVVTPVKTGVQSFSNYPKTLDSGFRRNDEFSHFLAFCENIKFEKDKVIALLYHIQYRGLTTASSPLFQSLPDPDDEPFLEVAIAAQAVCLVTGNRIHFPPDRCQNVQVLSPSEFLSFYKS